MLRMLRTKLDRSVGWQKWVCPFQHKLRDRNGVSLAIARVVRFYRRNPEEEVRGLGIVESVERDGKVVIRVTGGSRMRVVKLPYKRSIPVGESIGNVIMFRPRQKPASEVETAVSVDPDEDAAEAVEPPERIFYMLVQDIFGEEWVEVVRE